MMKTVVLVGVLAAWLPVTGGYKMLVSTLGISGSQNLLMYRLADMLGERGHAVTMLKLDVLPEAKSIKLKHAKEMVFPLLADEESRDLLRTQMSQMPWETTGGNPIPFQAISTIASNVLGGCRRLTKNAGMIKELENGNYDIILYHFVDFCTLGLSHRLGVNKTVIVSTGMMAEHMAYYSGTPAPPSWVPAAPVPSHPPLSLVYRAQSFAVVTAFTGFMRFMVSPAYTRVFREAFGADYPDLETLLHATSLYFVNADPFFEYPRPTMHNVIYMGGITMQKPEALKEDWEGVMNKSEKGVVLFSLGSVCNTSTMPIEIKRAFLEGFKAFPAYTFIWRLEGEFPEVKNVPNVKVSTWLPQRDLLGHPKMKAFITHGGYNSLTEATYMGVPLIMFPLFGDQYANVARVERHGVGVVLDKATVTAESVKDALHSVLDDHTYVLFSGSEGVKARVERHGVGVVLDKATVTAESVKDALHSVLDDHTYVLFSGSEGVKARVERHGVGVVLDKATVTAESVKDALHSVLDDHTYVLFSGSEGVKARVERHGVGVVLDKATVTAESVKDALHSVLDDHTYVLFSGSEGVKARVERHGVGVVLDKATVTAESVKDALHSVLDDHTVDAAARKLGRMIRGKPIGSYDQAMKWAEFLAEFGPLETLLPDSRNQTIVSYYMLDVLGILALALALLFILLFKLCACCCRSCCKSVPKKKRE